MDLFQLRCAAAFDIFQRPTADIFARPYSDAGAQGAVWRKSADMLIFAAQRDISVIGTS